LTFCTLTDSVTTISDISTVKEGEHITTLTGDSQLLSTKMTRISQDQYSMSTTVSLSRSDSVNKSGYFQLYKTSTDGSLMKERNSTAAMQNEPFHSTPNASILTTSRSIRVTEHEPSRRVTDFSRTQMGMVASKPEDPKYHTLSDSSTGKPFTIINNVLAVTHEVHFGRNTKILSNSSDTNEDAGICSTSLCRNGGTCKLKESGYSCNCTPNFQGIGCELGSDVFCIRNV